MIGVSPNSLGWGGEGKRRETEGGRGVREEGGEGEQVATVNAKCPSAVVVYFVTHFSC